MTIFIDAVVAAMFTLFDVSGWLVATAAGIGALLFLLQKVRQAYRWFDQVQTLVTRELTTNGGGSMLDKINSIKAAQADLASRVQTSVVLAQQAVEGQERIEGQVAAINTRLDAGEKRFRKLDRVTAALEDVARNNHPEDYPAGPDIED